MSVVTLVLLNTSCLYLIKLIFNLLLAEHENVCCLSHCRDFTIFIEWQSKIIGVFEDIIKDL